MVCIYCKGHLAVTNSRPQVSRNQTWRRRLCKACGAVFTAVEALDLSQSLAVAVSGRMEAFDRDRLFISLYESLRHRPTAASDARGLADTIVAHIITRADNGQVGLRTIANTCLNTLQRFDTAAASHYAAFHRQHQS